MKINKKLFLILIFIVNPVYASNYYFSLNYGVANQLFEPTVENNSLTIPNITYAKDYRDVDESSSSYSLSAGYKLSKDLALEVGFTQVSDVSGRLHVIDDGDLATNRVANETIDTDFTYVALVGEWRPLQNKLLLSAKLGLSSWQYEFIQQVSDIDDSAAPMPFPNPPSEPVNLPADVGLTPVGTESYNDSGTEFFYGVSLSYSIAPDLEISLEMESHSFDPEFNNIKTKQSMTIFFLGVNFLF